MASIKNDDRMEGSAAPGVLLVTLLAALGGLAYVAVENAGRLSGHPVRQFILPETSERAEHEIPLGFPVGGRIEQMIVKENTHVKKGDVLATLDKAPFERLLAAAQADLDVAQADYNRSLHIPTSNFNAIEAARASVESHQHVYDEARDELEKRRGMQVAGQLDNVYVDDVQNEHDALLELERARRKQAQLEDAAANTMDREQYRTEVAAAQTRLAIAQSNLAETQLLAPDDGVVVRKVADSGAVIQAESPVYILSVTPPPATEADASALQK